MAAMFFDLNRGGLEPEDMWREALQSFKTDVDVRSRR